MQHRRASASCAAVVTVALLVTYLAASGVTEAADRCLTRSEARALWPRLHLYWTHSSGRRCWSNRRGVRVGSPRQAVQVNRQPPAPPPVQTVQTVQTVQWTKWTPAETLADLMPPRWQDWLAGEPQRLATQWAWIAQARATGEDLAGPVFSSFDGPEPDTWPPLAQHAPFNAASLAILVLADLVAVAFGLALWRWNRDRVRLTRPENVSKLEIPR